MLSWHGTPSGIDPIEMHFTLLLLCRQRELNYSIFLWIISFDFVAEGSGWDPNLIEPFLGRVGCVHTRTVSMTTSTELFICYEATCYFFWSVARKWARLCDQQTPPNGYQVPVRWEDHIDESKSVSRRLLYPTHWKNFLPFCCLFSTSSWLTKSCSTADR